MSNISDYNLSKLLLLKQKRDYILSKVNELNGELLDLNAQIDKIAKTEKHIDCGEIPLGEPQLCVLGFGDE